jgi:hypothetical protein
MRGVREDTLVGDAQEGATGCGEEELFDRDYEYVDSEEVGDVCRSDERIRGTGREARGAGKM